MKRSVHYFFLSILILGQQSASAGVDDETRRILNESRIQAGKLQQGHEKDAITLIDEVAEALRKVDPTQDDKSLFAWYYGHRTILIAHRSRPFDDRDPRRSLEVANDMLPIAEKGLHPALKKQLPEQYFLMLIEKADILRDIAVNTFRTNKPHSESFFAQSVQLLEDALKDATAPKDKARLHEALALNHEVAAESHLACGAEGITPRTMKEHCGPSMQVALSHSRMVIYITSEANLEGALLEYRCNLMRRLAQAHYWRTNEPIASDSDEYMEGAAQLKESLAYARAHPEHPASARLLDYYKKTMSIPGIEADERFERFRKLVEPFIYKPPTPWYIREY